MNELLNSLGEVVKRKASNSLLGTFALFWIACHWSFFVILFFVDEQKILLQTGMLKNEYLETVLCSFNFKTIVHWLAPFVLTWLMIWKLPKWVLTPAFKQEESYRLEKQKIRIETDSKIESEKIKFNKQKVENLNVISEVKLKERDIQKIDPTIRWESEFEEFKSSPFYRNFEQIISSIYSHGGRIRTYDNSNDRWLIIPKETLAYCHSNGLIEFSDQKEESIINLTEKGKYFVKKYSHGESTLIPF